MAAGDHDAPAAVAGTRDAGRARTARDGRAGAGRVGDDGALNLEQHLAVRTRSPPRSVIAPSSFLSFTKVPLVDDRSVSSTEPSGFGDRVACRVETRASLSTTFTSASRPRVSARLTTMIWPVPAPWRIVMRIHRV